MRPRDHEDVAQQLDRDRARLVRPRRREEHVDAGVVRHHVVGELVLVERAAREREVVHRLLGRKPHAEADVAELEVEVDDEDLLTGEREGDREVARTSASCRSRPSARARR